MPTDKLTQTQTNKSRQLEKPSFEATSTTLLLIYSFQSKSAFLPTNHAFVSTFNMHVLSKM